MSLASVAAQPNAPLSSAAAKAASGGSQAAASSTTRTGQTALNSLTGNFSSFLNLLMTQLKNQNPTSPLDTNQFTTQLVQFAGVAQQITTNQSLTQLIQLTQSGEILNSSSIVGKQVAVTASEMPLQNGQGEVRFTPTAAGPVAIAVYTEDNRQVANATISATAGLNTWKWDGTDGSGTQLPDAAYKVAVMGLDAAGSPVAVPFAVVGTATGVQSQSNGVVLQMGAQSVPFSAVQSVLSTG